MAEYIDREAALMKLMQDGCSAKNLQSISDMPAADVAPVRHAKWEIVVGSNGKEYMVCTGCRKQQDLTDVFSYCPNCGAKIDEKENKRCILKKFHKS